MRTVMVVILMLVGCASRESAVTPTDAARDADMPDWEEWIPPDAEPLEAAPVDGGVPSCPALLDAGAPYERGIPAQAACDPAWVNPSSCPSSAPALASSCSTEGLLCHYSQWIRCSSGHWSGTSLRCSGDCVALDGGAAIVTAACGTEPEIPCPVNHALTDYERTNHLLRQLGDCCGSANENVLRAHFAGGCVQSLELMVSTPWGDEFLQCMVRLLSGRRLSCAPAGCAEAEWSTVK